MRFGCRIAERFLSALPKLLRGHTLPTFECADKIALAVVADKIRYFRPAVISARQQAFCMFNPHTIQIFYRRHALFLYKEMPKPPGAQLRGACNIGEFDGLFGTRFDILNRCRYRFCRRCAWPLIDILLLSQTNSQNQTT